MSSPPLWQTYYTPTSVEEALTILAENGDHPGPETRIVAGGTDLLVELQHGDRQAQVLIDITRIGGLDRVQQDDDGLIHIGPTVTHNLASTSSLLIERAFPLALACWRVGTPQLRNRGTIAGNLVTASPANDTITALWALGARLTLRSTRKERTLSFSEFYKGVHRTAIAPDEMVTDIAFPALNSDQRGTFAKLALRRTHAISVVNAAAVLTFDGDVVTQARITLGSVAPTIVRAPEAEGALIGAPLNEERITEAAELAIQTCIPIDDIRAGADYRRHVVGVLVRRALTTLRDGSERAEFPAARPNLWGNSEGRFPRLAGRTVRHRDEGPEPIECSVNGENVVVRGAGGKTLLAMLREDLGLTGTKEGCGEGECGACTVWMDGIAVLACLTPAPRAHGTHVVTIEGLAQNADIADVGRASADVGRASADVGRASADVGRASADVGSDAADLETGTADFDPDARSRSTASRPRSEASDGLHPVQRAFIEEGAVQCGFCTPGFVMAGANLLEEIPHPTREQIIAGLTGNLCRCTGYYKIVRAIEKAANT